MCDHQNDKYMPILVTEDVLMRHSGAAFDKIFATFDRELRPCANDNHDDVVEQAKPDEVETSEKRKG